MGGQVERSRFIVNVEVAVVRDGRYLATVRGEGVTHGAGWLGFPGGSLDWDGPLDDAVEATARREVLEEVGISLDDPILYIESHTFGDAGPPVFDIVVLARAGGGKPFASAPDEVAAVMWMTADELRADGRTQEWTRRSLDLAEARRAELGW
jgi:8-oxo-dGTP diphosphatase